MADTDTTERKLSGLKLAAQGNAFALFDCARLSLKEAKALGEADDIAAACAFGEAITFARLLASDGTVGSNRTLFEAVSAFADWAGEWGRDDVRDSLQAAAINILDSMADAGDESAAEVLARCGDCLPFQTFEIAKRQREGAKP